MADNSYPIEIKICSKNGWFTPSEAQNYYGRYSREGITVHWWGDGTGASNHDNIVNYFMNQAQAGNKSVNYVCSDNKITLMVGPDNVAWASQGGNPTTVSVEFQPTLGAEGYKKGGWLIDQLEQRWGRKLNLYPHSKWYATACPGTIDINRLRAEADKWKNGGYNPLPPPPSVPEWQANKRIFAPVVKYTLANAKLVDVNTLIASKTYTLDTPIEIKGETRVNGKEFWFSTYSIDNNKPNGFLKADLKDSPTPPPQPEPVPEPTPEPPKPSKDDEQDARLTALEKAVAALKAVINKIISFFKGV